MVVALERAAEIAALFLTEPGGMKSFINSYFTKQVLPRKRYCGLGIVH